MKGDFDFQLEQIGECYCCEDDTWERGLGKTTEFCLGHVKFELPIKPVGDAK